MRVEEVEGGCYTSASSSEQEFSDSAEQIVLPDRGGLSGLFQALANVGDGLPAVRVDVGELVQRAGEECVPDGVKFRLEC
jgi:hypothetical protein